MTGALGQIIIHDIIPTFFTGSHPEGQRAGRLHLRHQRADEAAQGGVVAVAVLLAAETLPAASIVIRPLAPKLVTFKKWVVRSRPSRSLNRTRPACTAPPGSTPGPVR